MFGAQKARDFSWTSPGAPFKVPVVRLPESLEALVDEGIVAEVVRPLMSGKEAQIYLVVAGGAERVAKIYKDADNRSFKHRSAYAEGRGVRNSRDQRAMQKRSSYGRSQDEAAWRSTEVDMIYRLRDAGVRVPEPWQFFDGILIMELVRGADGHPAPRLAESELDPATAKRVFEQLLREVVRMLASGVVHGDLSPFNVLMTGDGPVVIDFPQAIDASRNQNAKEILLRDVANLITWYARFDGRVRSLRYGHEIWAAYERAELTPDMPLTGMHKPSESRANLKGVLDEIAAADREELRRRDRAQAPSRPIKPQAPQRPGVREVVIASPRHRGPKGPPRRNA